MRKVLLIVGATLMLGGCWRASTDLNSILVGLFAEKYETSASDIDVDIEANTDHHARGTVRLGEGPGNAGGFLASDTLGDWEIVWDGNGAYYCSEVEPYGFPSAFIEDCFDEKNGEIGEDGKIYETPHESILMTVIRDLFLAEPGFEDLRKDEIELEIMPESTGNYAKGTVEISGGGPGNTGGWLATDYNTDGTLGEWELVWHGNGMYECGVLDSYGFPNDLREGCYEAEFSVDNSEVEYNVGMEDSIKQALADKHGRDKSEVELTINDEEPSFAKGLVKFSGDISGAMFFAAEVGGQWVIVWDGNGVYECSLLNDYGFPESWKDGCM